TSFIIISLCYCSAIADTITAKAQQAFKIDVKDNPLRQYAAKSYIKSDSALVSENEVVSGSTINQDQAPKANDYGDA
ncbi:hypothetical protein NAH08_13085, partial [Francisella tularensis subsp. holarctica]|nr:hypothetical protein [Francisella tularensis subsp. holarctica]